MPLPHRLLLLLIFAMLLIFVGQRFSPNSLVAYMAVPAEVTASWEALRDGQAGQAEARAFTTLLSAAFLHADWDHLFFNMLFLWVFAGLVGELLGGRWLLAIFLLSAVGGSLGDVLSRPESTIPLLGASGAVMGFEGAYLGLAVRWQLPWPQIWPIAHPIPPLRLALVAVGGYILDIMGMVGPATGIAHGAHLGGFLVGLVLTSLIAPAPRHIS
ncbi:rhomboid family intramembrane serine protease [Roseibacillus ishigakijimensis]|uniref:Rhomboid family intramembrane serine protease n=1 Tax=Roseibacillus ishigakijimensis TaxID=454146 RepID=A0A934RT59_9BACT|nr:rhomboid family intramembrane serine protease [Roseibacillus ishigakijimensis]MBK1833730.1 rhomboid family intramembrane serine protease [Roseibacillus ishigakijimensis]